MSRQLFYRGLLAERFPALVQEIDQAGHEIGYHSYLHQRISSKTNQELIHAMTEVCQRQAWVSAAWVFGSTAKGTAGSGSDIDIAILADNTMTDYPILPLITALERTAGRRVDVMVLNRAGDLLRYEVRKHGRLLFERDPLARKEFKVRSKKSFEDFLHIHQRSESSREILAISIGS